MEPRTPLSDLVEKALLEIGKFGFGQEVNRRYKWIYERLGLREKEECAVLFRGPSPLLSHGHRTPIPNRSHRPSKTK